MNARTMTQQALRPRQTLESFLQTQAGTWFILAFIAAHVPVAILMRQLSGVATLHALAVLAVGIWWAAERRVERVTWAAAYIVGSEVFWRMAQAGVPWEFGKYAMSLVLLVALVRTKQLRPPALALAYFLLLIPATWITAFLHPLGEARQMISFNLSGPFALFVSVWFFRRCVFLGRHEFIRLALILIAPAVGIATFAAFGMVSAGDLSFTGESNFVTSGGFGPNQVSAMLGLGMVGCAFALAFGRRGTLRIGLLAIFGLLLVQSALTFSRTGLALTLISLAAFIPFILGTARQRFAVLGLLALLFVFVQIWMIPTLDDFTGGAFVTRYSDLDLAHRESIMAMDLTIWSQHPVLGIGAGRAIEAREALGIWAAAHTEYTRMVAEHGAFGFVALLLLLAMGAWPLLRRQSPAERGVHLALVFWAFAFMVVSAFRLAAPALLLGMCWAPLVLDAQVSLLRERYLNE